MDPDAFWGRPPRAPSADPSRVEDYACRRALRVSGQAPAGVLRAAGVAASGPVRLRFAYLVDHVDFPAQPLASASLLDPPWVLWSKFRKSRLWAEWNRVWDEHPSVRPVDRVLLFRDAAWGLAAVRPLLGPVDAAVDSPHVVCGFGVSPYPLRIEPFDAWLGVIGWAGTADDTSAA